MMYLFAATMRVIPVAVLLLAVLMPFIIAYRRLHERVFFNVLAADSMYYMGLASNFIKVGFPSFDHEGITNGYHPLWLLLLTGTFKLLSIEHHNQVAVTTLISLALVLAALGILVVCFARQFGNTAGVLGALLLVPGLYDSLIAPQTRDVSEPGVLYSLTPWSAANGVETPLSLFFWAVLLATVARRAVSLAPSMPHVPGLASDAIWSSIYSWPARLAIAGIVLTRLDDGLLLPAVGLTGLVAMRGSPFSRRMMTLVRVLWFPVIFLGFYMTINLATVGAALPVSGMGKTSFALRENLNLLPGIITGDPGSHWWVLATRVYAVVFFLFAGVAMAAMSIVVLRRNDERHNNWFYVSVLVVGSSFVILKSSFYFNFVYFWNQGFWYYFSMMLVINFMAVWLLLDLLTSKRRWMLPAMVVAATLTAASLPSKMNDLSSVQRRTVFSNDYADLAFGLWKHGGEIRAALHTVAPGAKLIDNLDGMYGYLLDMPAVTVTGLVSSPDELSRRSQLGFWPSTLSRGFTLVGDFGYLKLPDYTGQIEMTAVYQHPAVPITFYQVRLRKN
jgi:hypothetical protein